MQGSFLFVEVYLFSSAIFSDFFSFDICNTAYLKHKDFYALSVLSISDWIFYVNLCIWNKHDFDAS